jgi:XTP/dITP diphosphohydrolase
VLAFADSQGSLGGEVHTVSGTLEGTIATATRGTKGFGYDPLFIPVGETRTLAEMDDEEKDRQSHRGKAAIDMCHFLVDYFKK